MSRSLLRLKHNNLRPWRWYFPEVVVQRGADRAMLHIGLSGNYCAARVGIKVSSSTYPVVCSFECSPTCGQMSVLGWLFIGY